MRKKIFKHLWEGWCLCSIVGIWPRHIEPRLLRLTKKTLQLENWPSALDGLTLVQISDLHYQLRHSTRFFDKIHRHLQRLKPDLILFTGDWINRSKLDRSELLSDFLAKFHAPLGCFTILGNHDYSRYVTKDYLGRCCIEDRQMEALPRTLSRLLYGRSSAPLQHEADLKNLKPHPQLVALLEKSPFQLLHNRSLLIPVGSTHLNLCGLGDLWLNQCDLQKGFSQYDTRYPGIILTHNPDTFVPLKSYPGNLLLAGHTHGGQVNIPGLWQRCIGIDHLEYKRGLHKLGDKRAYVNRGLGAHLDFRWFSPPEITHLTLRSRCL